MGEATDAGSLLARFPRLGRLGASFRRRRVPFVQQTTAADCGAACLAMVLDLFGKEVRLDEIRDLASVGRDGSDAGTLMQAGRWYGLRARAVRIEDLDRLRYLPIGAVLHWEFKHFVVLERPVADGIVVVDPAAGRRRVARDEVGRCFTGIALVFEPAEDFEPGRARSSGVRRYLREISAESRLVSRLVVTSLLLQVFALATPLVTGLVVDRMVPHQDVPLLRIVAIGALVLVLFHFLASLIRSHLLLELRTRLDSKVTLQFLEHLMALPYRFFQERSSGDLMMRLNSNATIREILTSSVLSGLLDGFLVTSYLVLLWIIHWPMALLVLVLAGLRVLVFAVTRRTYRERTADLLLAQARSRSFQVEMLGGVQTLKLANATDGAIERWGNLFIDELNVSLKQGRLFAFIESSLAALGLASPLVVLLFGAVEVIQGRLSLGMMLAVSALAAGFLLPLSTLVLSAVKLQLLGGYLERINDVLEHPREQEAREDLRRPGRLRGRITLEGVGFRYSALSPFVVRNVDLDIEEGRFVAIIGPSGAGKTTLAHLILGLYEPVEGRVLYDGLDLRTLEIGAARAQLGIVPQEPYVFGTSIRRNVSLSAPDTPFARIVEACRAAGLHDEIMAMPMGYDTVLADGGASLSGGQRQRLALARALVNRPSVLVLDEATSNVDTLRERKIQEELERQRSTRIVVAHRLSTVQNADLILVMEEGEIRERGRHEELVARQGLYSRLIGGQMFRPTGIE